MNNADIADDIIGVMRTVQSQFPPKGSPELDANIEIPLSVRLWRISGCHELLASLGFDLMEVGQDQVTLRTGKQANRRNCQFVLQALLALFDTQEAPKSLGIDSSSSCESLNEDIRSEKRVNSLSPIPGTPSSNQQCVSPVGTVKSLNLKLPRPQLPTRPPLLSSGSAFSSYVRKRGEPDGGRNEPMMTQPILPNIELNTDSDISDSYSTQIIKAKPDYLRTPIKVGRPGGGGESDATFTPSPPITLQNVDSNVSMALAHQTRIRNLYSTNPASAPTNDGHGHVQSLQKPDDSSSSASSTTNDWDVSGHATVLRRAQQNQLLGMPPMPPPRQKLPMVDSLRPLAPYNNLGGSKNNVIESTSSDSEFERTYDANERNVAQKISHHQFLPRKIPEECLLMDRLSVRTENTANVAPSATSSRKPTQSSDSDVTLPFKFNSNHLYFSSSDSDIIEPQHKDISLTLKANSAKENTKPTLSSHSKNIQDLILRQINREMTPTISDVYHERNIELGLAPKLSMLLSKNYDDNESNTNTIKKANSAETVSDINLNSTINAIYTSDNVPLNDHCEKCNNLTPGIMCQCKNTAKLLSSKWLNNLVASSTPSTAATTISTNDLGVGDVTNRQNNLNGKDSDSQNLVENGNNSTNIVSGTLKRGNSPYSDLSKRDEGDGRSVADSQCSGSYKVVDINTTSKINQIQQRINKFNMNCANNTQN